MRIALLSATGARTRTLLKLLHGRTMCSKASNMQALHEALHQVSWLVGKWKGEGCGVYPTISPFMYGEEMIFDHVGQPMLSFNFSSRLLIHVHGLSYKRASPVTTRLKPIYSSRTWHLESGDPMHNEVGFLRVKPGTSTVALIIAQNSGLAEVSEGEVNGHEIHLLSNSVARMSFGADPQVLKVERRYKLKDADTLEMECFMQTTKTDLQKHLHITYKKVTD